VGTGNAWRCHVWRGCIEISTNGGDDGFGLGSLDAKSGEFHHDFNRKVMGKYIYIWNIYIDRISRGFSWDIANFMRGSGDLSIKNSDLE